MDSPVSILAKQNKVGATKMDMYLSDYIKRTQEKLKKEETVDEPKSDPNDYLVFPEENDSDRPRNPYSPV